MSRAGTGCSDARQRDPALVRAIVSDDGREIWLTIYEGNALVSMPLAPVRAVALAGELIRAALPKFDCAERCSTTGATQKRRGGDRHSNKRAQRDGGISELVQLLGADLSLAEKARRIIEKATRYQ